MQHDVNSAAAVVSPRSDGLLYGRCEVKTIAESSFTTSYFYI